MSSIGKRLKQERERLGLHQLDVSEITGVSRRTQSLYENDVSSPSASYLQQLAEHGVDVQYVVTGERQRINARLLAESLGAIEVALNERGISADAAKRIRLAIFVAEELSTGSNTGSAVSRVLSIID